ncbi:2-amino-3,7-dideoxy-D-threo-hept-6-ulosonate synthase [Streptomyces sp. XM4193]|uniref:2-amino-3,7-dideoxy-D-threo-hept-6-ulosonate synthase n=1 Tax=Streptomyces sp. XM4193 TaxID=2929782 RepID=UPI001FFBB97B|nr:2-amino-3,7-dideoxy-D-threo-hept-6-ulosonate synthase [Streptomyces sp. XM4193]MCK1798566.1 2-amino-3,7-dideoxy-D-threo-hept-6-ulosonate synthase [Streptomyces sp. XM4193]
MTTHEHFARGLRLRRLHRHDPQRLFLVPLDHSISDGPVVPRGLTMDRLVGQLAAGGADAIIVHKGSLRHINPARLADTSLILHLNASTAHAPDPDAKYMVTGVEDALRLGADAVSMHINMGSLEEQRQIADLGAVADRCDRWNLPLLAMMYPRGPKITNPADPELVAHAVTVAADLGADIVKAPYVGPPSVMRELVSACPIPLVCAGGPRRGDSEDALDFVRDVISGGAAGVAMGRNIFQAPDPRAMAAGVARVVHRLPDRIPGAATIPDQITEGRGSERQETVLA